MSNYATREDLEAYGVLTLGGVTLPPARPVADPPYGLDLDRIGETVYGVRRGEEESDKAYRLRCLASFYGPVPTVRSWIAEVADAARVSPRAQAKARAARFEAQLPGLLDAAPKGARDGFGRRQGPGWDAWLRALADVREQVVCGAVAGQHAMTVLAMAYTRWAAITGVKADAYQGTPGGEP